MKSQRLMVIAAALLLAGPAAAQTTGEGSVTFGAGDAWIETSFKGDYRFIGKQRWTPFVSGGYRPSAR